MTLLLVGGRPVAFSAVLAALALAACATPALDDALVVADDRASSRGVHGSHVDAGSGDGALKPSESGGGSPGTSASTGGAFGAYDGGAGKDGGGGACPLGAAGVGWLCDGFEGTEFDAEWSKVLVQGGGVGLHKGGATGAGSFGAGFGTLPPGIGQAALSAALPGTVAASGAGLRFAVRVPRDGYPTRVGIGALRGAGGSAFVLELDVNGTQLVVRDTTGAAATMAVGTIPFDQWTCVSVELDVAGNKVHASIPGVTHSMPITAARASVALTAVEVGLTYDAGANANASIGLGFDDVVIGRGVTPCGAAAP